MGSNLNQWTEDENKFLIENKDKYTSIKLGELMGRSESSIRNRLRKLGLYKERDTKYVVERNKKMGRDLSYENLKEIASKYKTKSEFMFMDHSAYITARRLKIMDDICGHMINKVVSIPQMILKTILNELFQEECLYDTRDIIKPYEIDIFYQKYNLGFEYNGKLWHNIHDNSDKKTELCKSKNITLIFIHENSRRYEEDIKKQLIENLDLINSVTSLNISIENIKNYVINYSELFSTYMDKDETMSLINSYDNFHLFKKQHPNLYQKLVKMKVLDEYTSHLKRDRVSWNLELCEKEINKHETLKDLYEKSSGCYNFIRKNKEYNYLLDKLKRLKN